MKTKELIFKCLKDSLTIKETITKCCELQSKQPCNVNFSKVLNKILLEFMSKSIFFVIRFNSQYYDKKIKDISLDDYIISQLARIGFLMNTGLKRGIL